MQIGPWLSVLRALRILRVLRLLQFSAALRQTIGTLIRAVGSLSYLVLLLLLLVFVYALLGMEFFGGFYPRPDRNYTRSLYPEVFEGITWADDMPPPRENFDSLSSALVVVFVALTGENWNEIFFATHEATFEAYSVLPQPAAKAVTFHRPPFRSQLFTANLPQPTHGLRVPSTANLAQPRFPTAYPHQPYRHQPLAISVPTSLTRWRRCSRPSTSSLSTSSARSSC